MAYDALRTIMPIAGWPEDRAREVEISVGADPCCRPGFASAARGCSEKRTKHYELARGFHAPVA